MLLFVALGQNLLICKFLVKVRFLDLGFISQVSEFFSYFAILLRSHLDNPLTSTVTKSG